MLFWIIFGIVVILGTAGSAIFGVGKKYDERSKQKSKQKQTSQYDDNEN